MFDEFLNKASSLRQKGEPFAIAFVVRFEGPISSKPGNKAIIDQDGKMTGWIGGGCTKSIVIEEGLAAIEDGQPRLIRVSPEGDTEIKIGIMRHNMTCHSGGTVDVYIEPVLPAPHLIIMGKSLVAQALCRLGKVMNYRITVMGGSEETELFRDADQYLNEYSFEDIHLNKGCFVVVSTQGEGDEDALLAVLRTEAEYIAFVSSRKKANGVYMYLKDQGMKFEDLVRIKSPAGLDILARLPEEIALSILAEIIKHRRTSQSSGPMERLVNPEIYAIDPICKMKVQKADAKYISSFKGGTYYFCCPACKTEFERRPEVYVAVGEES